MSEKTRTGWRSQQESDGRMVWVYGPQTEVDAIPELCARTHPCFGEAPSYTDAWNENGKPRHREISDQSMNLSVIANGNAGSRPTNVGVNWHPLPAEATTGLRAIAYFLGIDSLGTQVINPVALVEYSALRVYEQTYSVISRDLGLDTFNFDRQGLPELVALDSTFTPIRAENHNS